MKPTRLKTLSRLQHLPAVAYLEATYRWAPTDHSVNDSINDSILLVNMVEFLSCKVQQF